MTTSTRFARRALMIAIPTVMVLAFSGCDDGSSTPDTTTVGDDVDGGGTDVDDLTDDGGIGTVLPSDTSPGATEAPNPNAGGGGGGGDGGGGTGTPAP